MKTMLNLDLSAQWGAAGRFVQQMCARSAVLQWRILENTKEE